MGVENHPLVRAPLEDTAAMETIPMNAEPVVYVVDDNQDTRDALRCLIESVSLNVETCESAHAFLAVFQFGRPACLVLDVRMPGMSGLDLQEKLAADGCSVPVIIITGHGDVSMAVRAMKAGALDFVEKPFSEQALLDRVQQAIHIHKGRLRDEAVMANIDERIKRLSPREHDVMGMVVTGKSNKAIAENLGLSPKTVEVHRARVMEKMSAKSLPELVRLHVQSTGA